MLLLAACELDNSLASGNEKTEDFDTSSDWQPPGTETGNEEPTDEVCDGFDNDGDGEVDEGFPDTDGDGLLDCLDSECPALVPGDAGTITIDEACLGESGGGGGAEVTDPWNVKTKWTFSAPAADSSATNSYAQPVIGNLDDDNGDGTIDEDDSPEVVISAFGSRGYLVAIDGATGREKWSYANTSTTGAALIADIDSDGYPDVVGYDQSARPIALEGDGTLKWTASRSPTSTSYPLVSVADLDGDGNPEVIADDLVLNGEDGSVEFSLNNSVANPYRIAAVADADLDGDQEIYMGGNAYDSDGSLLWSTGEAGSYGFWPVIVQGDSDPEAEIGFVGDQWTLWDDDGTNIYRRNYGSTTHPGPPCVGDFDGDGESDVAWPSYQTLVAYHLDGSAMWSQPIDDTSGLAGCSGWDVNGDGALEVLFADQTTFTIFDGATGVENYVDNQHRSGTVFEYPTIADMDADGHGEIAYVSNYGAPWGVLKVIEHDGGGWPAAGSTWAIHDFAISNVNADGSVPTSPDPYWTKYNVYRSRIAADDPSTPDLVASITDVCVSASDCVYGEVKLAFQVSNQGGADVTTDFVVKVYSYGTSDVEVASITVTTDLLAGERLVGQEVDLLPQDVGVYGFKIKVDGTDTVTECDELNNEDVYTDVYCE